MLKEIHDKLTDLTEEELKILSGENSVNKSIYSRFSRENNNRIIYSINNE